MQLTRVLHFQPVSALNVACKTFEAWGCAKEMPVTTLPGQSGEAEERKDSCCTRAQGPCLRLQGPEAAACHRDSQQPSRAGGPFTFSGPDSHGMPWPARGTGQQSNVICFWHSVLNQG